MTVKQILSLLLLALVLGGCASGAKYADVEPRIPPVPPDKGRIYFYRTTSMGAAVQPKVRLGEEVVGSAVPRGFFFVDAEPGDQVVSCSTEAAHRLSFTLAAREERYVKLLLRMGLLVGHVLPVLVEPETARGELAGMRFTGLAELLLAEAAPEQAAPEQAAAQQVAP